MKKYRYLRGRLAEADISLPRLAEALMRSESYVAQRMAGAAPWEQDEQYAIMDMIGEPDERLHVVFPRGGIEQEPAADDRVKKMLIALTDALAEAARAM